MSNEEQRLLTAIKREKDPKRHMVLVLVASVMDHYRKEFK